MKIICISIYNKDLFDNTSVSLYVSQKQSKGN